MRKLKAVEDRERKMQQQATRRETEVAAAKKGDAADAVIERHDTQHMGFGRRLMLAAEDIAHQNGYRKIAVIAGIGTREYYRKKLGYQLDGTYMVKEMGIVYGLRKFAYAHAFPVLVAVLAILACLVANLAM